jgi:predicted DNA-binding transcriptional regulator AlpA
METYTFRLVVADLIDDEGANRLFDAGVEDGVPESGPEGHLIGFDREAASLQDAVLSAIDEVESADFEVLRVEPDELVSAADVAERTRRSRQSISSLISGARGPGAWPRPVAGNVRSPLWRWSDIRAWFEEFDGSLQVNKEEAAFLAAVNEVLAARRALEPLDRHAKEQLLRQLAS